MEELQQANIVTLNKLVDALTQNNFRANPCDLPENKLSSQSNGSQVKVNSRESQFLSRSCLHGVALYKS